MSEEQTPEQKAETEAQKANSYQKRKEEIEKAALEMNKLKSENEAFKKKYEDLEQSKLQEQNNWKALAEIEKKKREETEVEKKKLEKAFVTTVKRAEVHREAMAAGIREEALRDLDLLNYDTVAIETTSSGHINVLGSKEYIESLKAERKHWFKDASNVNVNNSNPATPKDKVYSSDEILKLEKENPAEYKKFMAKKYNLK